jgi:hypothetical protein
MRPVSVATRDRVSNLGPAEQPRGQPARLLLSSRSFAHTYETGRMRRLHLRGQANVLKRLLIHVGGFNLSLVMRKLVREGTPRGLLGLSAAVLLIVLSFWTAILARTIGEGLPHTCVRSIRYHGDIMTKSVPPRAASVIEPYRLFPQSIQLSLYCLGAGLCVISMMSSPNARHGDLRCKASTRAVALYFYDELSLLARKNLKMHARHCKPCSHILKQLRRLRLVLGFATPPKPSPQLLTSSRLRLSRALNSGRHRARAA